MNQQMGRSLPAIAGLLVLVVLFTVLLLGLSWVMGPVAIGPVPVAAQNTACYRAQGGDVWVCASGGEMEFRAGATLDVQAGAAVNVATVLNLTPARPITVTNGAAFVPTASYQPIVSAGTVTPTISTSGADAGDVVRLVVTSNTTINLADTGNQVLSAAFAMGQYDTLTVVFDGTRWIEWSRSNN